MKRAHGSGGGAGADATAPLRLGSVRRSFQAVFFCRTVGERGEQCTNQREEKGGVCRKWRQGSAIRKTLHVV